MPTLFLDRDGVINVRIPGDYVRNWAEFVFCPGVLEALPLLAKAFDPIVVVTNQAGIAKGRMSEQDVLQIHQKMQAATAAAGGRIDRVYYCPEKEADAPCRKPNPGMAFAAQRDYPHINFAQSWMVGDSLSDMYFAQQLHMHTALVSGKAEESTLAADFAADWKGGDLLGFAVWWEEVRRN